MLQLGIIGYLTFGSKVGSNIIAMYPPTSFTIALGRLGIVMLVGLSYPLQCLPCRACLHTLTSGLIKKKRATAPADVADITEDTSDNDDVDDDDVSEQDTLVPKGDGHLPRGGDMTRTKFIVLTSGILISGFLIAAVVDELEVGKYRAWSTALMAITDWTRSSRLRRVYWINHHLVHPPRLLLLPPLPGRKGANQVVRARARHLRHGRHGVLVSVPIRTIARLGMLTPQSDV